MHGYPVYDESLETLNGQAGKFAMEHDPAVLRERLCKGECIQLHGWRATLQSCRVQCRGGSAHWLEVVF